MGFIYSFCSILNRVVGQYIIEHHVPLYSTWGPPQLNCLQNYVTSTCMRVYACTGTGMSLHDIDILHAPFHSAYA